MQNKLDRRTNKVIEDKPKSVKTGDGCDVLMKPMRPLVVETFKGYPPLGRFAVRDMRMTVAVGVINSTKRKALEVRTRAGRARGVTLDVCFSARACGRRICRPAPSPTANCPPPSPAPQEKGKKAGK